MNERLNRRSIHSFTTSPGIAATNIVRDQLSWILITLMVGLFYVVRSVTS
jgi:hypothetical protein